MVYWQLITGMLLSIALMFSGTWVGQNTQYTNVGSLMLIIGTLALLIIVYFVYLIYFNWV